MRDLYHNLLADISLKFAAYTAAQNGQVTVDLQGYDGALVLFLAGAITDGEDWEFELKESDDDSTYTPVADGDLLGTEPNAIKNADDDKDWGVGYIGNKRYLRADLKTSGSPTTGGVFGAVIIRGFPRHAPVV